MIYTRFQCTTAIVFALVVSFCPWNSIEVRGERVGYAFEGVFIQPVWSGTGQPPTEYNVFGVPVPFDAPLAGTFSYDTTTVGVVPFEGAKDFKQFIQAGFSFNVFDPVGGARILQLVANTYPIRVVNDFTPSGAPTASDLLGVEFNTLSDPTLPRILKNGSPYTKTTIITALLSWDWPTFNDPDEPKLRSELPQDDFFPFQGSILAQGTATFVINSFSRIAASSGDYNFDGKVDESDYSEWRKAFGQSSQFYSYADGNQDGIVGAADYVIWRCAMGQRSAGSNLSLVPEPSALMLTTISVTILARHKRRRLLCC